MKQELSAKVSKSVQFLKTDIWRLRANKLPANKSFWINQLRIVILAIRGFNEDKCQLRASALTFYSLLSIVPVVAMAFGIAKGFGLEKILEAQIIEGLEGQEDVAERIIGFARSLLENARGGAIAGVGIAVLFWTVIKVLGNIEDSFNDIWGIKKARAFGRKLADYLSVMMICPFLLITASSIAVLLTTRITSIIENLSFLGYVGDVAIFTLRILPYAVIWVVFTFVYVFMPNTKVNFKAGLWAGIFAGTVYQVAQYAYIEFQVGVSKYGAIYGSFAALPLFLVWLQVSWLIVLFGAEVSFAHQNVETYEFETDCLNVSRAFKKIAALTITHLCVREFLRAQKPLTAEDISHELEMPIRLVRSVLFELTEVRILSEVYTDDRVNIGYQPGCYIDDLTVATILERLDERGIDTLPIVESQDMDKFRETIRRFHDMTANSPDNLKIKEL